MSRRTSRPVAAAGNAAPKAMVMVQPATTRANEKRTRLNASDIGPPCGLLCSDDASNDRTGQSRVTRAETPRFRGCQRASLDLQVLDCAFVPFDAAARRIGDHCIAVVIDAQWL